MRPPIDPEGWHLASQISWFSQLKATEIINSSARDFKNRLKVTVLKIVTELNRALHEKIDAWHYLRPHHEYFGLFVKGIVRLALSNDEEFGLTFSERYNLLTFFNYLFNSIEVDFINNQIKRYLPLSIWINLSASKREKEFSRLSKRIRSAWNKLQEQDKRLEPDILNEKNFERRFIFLYLKQFLNILRSTVVENQDESTQENKGDSLISDLNQEKALYCQRFLEFVIDLESQLPLRRFFHAILDYTNFIVRCQLSRLARHNSSDGHLFDQLISLLELYFRYEIDLMTGDPLDVNEISRRHEEKVLALQKLFWTKYEHLKEFAIKPIRGVDNPSALYRVITSFSDKSELYEFLQTIGLVDEESLNDEDKDNASLMSAILMGHYRRYESQLKKINSIPLFPNESVIWDTNLVPDQFYNYEYPLALPKLNLQFLTLSDYLLRNFMLFKNESTYEIRQDLEEGIVRSKCRWTDQGKFATGPKQRMALIIKDFNIIEIGKPKLGEACPSKVRAKVVINMDYVKPEWRREWEQLRKHDTCFLVSFRKESELDPLAWPGGTFPQKYCVKYVRGCEIENLLDSDGKAIDENHESPNFTDNIRTYIVCIDCNQYKMDQDTFKSTKQTVYDKFHLFVRRKPEQNNFKGVLETIRSLINTKFVVPDWLRNLLIGFGDPADAHYSNLRDSKHVSTIDYYDTFLDYQHLKESFTTIRPDYELCIGESVTSSNLAIEPPFRIQIDDLNKKLIVIPYKIPSRGPYPTHAPKKNTIRFTPTQIEAITSGSQPGLTMVVGPPGTGKTDVAVQILSTLYHSYPEQRTLIVTHSNQALNQIFEKMIELDVKEHHLLRMGHGEGDLQSQRDFSRQGRVRSVLTKRLELLIHVNRLARSLGLEAGQSLTCQSAEYFQSYHIVPRWDQYIDSIEGTEQVEKIGDKFPFSRFFDDAPQPLFKRQSVQEDFEIAKGCYRHITEIFELLQAFRPFEIFQNVSDRSKYLLIREAKVIAMTCTHAGLRRKELVDMNFQYDNILMEETAQILEIETTIPLLLQNPENGVNRLKRWIMIGDHNQLPPIIQNTAFQKFSNMEQSLFARFIRLGVPAIELDAQGRARPSICDLYRWRYKNLKELDHINQRDEFRLANAGFVYEYQMVNVDDGPGEQTPMPHYYQNRGEAEFVIALYKYMRQLGYPGDKITLLTTYNGQKQLLKELLEQEYAKAPELGKPNKVTTVDKYQGQQNDYVLLSLVRTKSIGHLRNVRRLVVAMSRARLGLYVFARVNLFKSCFELQNTLRYFMARPQALCLLKSAEKYPSDRLLLLSQDIDIESSQVHSVRNVHEMQQLVS